MTDTWETGGTDLLPWVIAVTLVVVAAGIVVPLTSATAPTAQRGELTDGHDSGGPERVDTVDSAARGGGLDTRLADAGQTPEIAVTPLTLRFPDDADGEVSRTFAVANVGNTTLRVRSIDVVGPDQAVFDHDFEGPATVEPGENRTVTVTYSPSDGSPRFGTVHVISDDPNAPQVNVWLTNTEMVADVSPSRLVGNLTMVNSTVQNAVPNVSQSVNISWPLTRDDVVAVDALAFTPERRGNFSVNVTKSTRRFSDVEPFNLSDGTESAAFVQIDHTIPNEDVRNVTITFRVRKDRLADNETDPEDVALYRYRDGSWNELPTRPVDEDDTHYFFEAASPGFSDFATGVKQAKFRIAEAVVTVTTISTDEGTEVLVRVNNEGGADGTYTVRLLSEEELVDRQELSIAPDSTRQATFGLSYDRPGTYQLFVNDQFVANLTVSETGTALAPASDDGGDGMDEPAEDQPGTTAVTGLGFSVVLGILAVLAGIGYAIVRQRN